MSKQQSMMIIAFLLLVRILAFNIIFKANEWNNKHKWTEQLLRNFKIVSGLLYKIVLIIFEEKCPIINDKPSVLLPIRIPPLIMGKFTSK